MKFTEVHRFAEKDGNKSNKGKEECSANQQSKINVQGAISDRRSQVTDAAVNALKKAQVMISRTPQIQQFLIGGASGLATGFVSSKIGKTAAFISGGSILFIVSANQAGVVNINWDKFGKKLEETGSKIEAKVPAWKGNIGKYARANTYFAAGFIGGFLIGISY